MSESCIVCLEVAGEIDLPGGILWEDAEAIAFHVPPTDATPVPCIGQCLVVTRRHVDHLADLTDQESASVARASRALVTVLRATGVEGVTVDAVGPGHVSAVVGGRQGHADVITDFVNGLRAHL